jgi:hypothetical protein
VLAFLLGSPETAALIGPETDPLYGHDGGAFLGDEQRMKERGPRARLEARLEAWSDLQRLAIQAKGHFGASIEAIAVQCQTDWGKVQESPVASQLTLARLDGAVRGCGWMTADGIAFAVRRSAAKRRLRHFKKRK